MENSLVNLAFGLVYFLLFVGRTYFKLLSNSFFDSYKGLEPKWLIVYRSVIGTILIIFTFLYITRRVPDFLILDLPTEFFYFGILVAIFSLFLIFWSHIKLGKGYSPSVGKTIKLVKDGPYAYIRHPMYVGYILLFFATFLFTGWWLFFVLGELIMLSLVVWRLKIEESILENRFGDEYKDYSKKVKRFIPFVF